jgi:hypothetical protein
MPPGFAGWIHGEWPLATAVTSGMSAADVRDLDGPRRCFEPRQRRTRAPPAPGSRRNAMLRPSGDQAGIESRKVDGATNRTG